MVCVYVHTVLLSKPMFILNFFFFAGGEIVIYLGQVFLYLGCVIL